MRYLSTFIIFFCFALTTCAHAENKSAISLKAKLLQAHPGDYIVTEQNKNYSLLAIRSVLHSTIVLEEISIPANQMDASKTPWKKWVESEAPGHTSWTWYEIDLENGTLNECFSFSKQGWLVFNESEQFFTKLISLPLSKTPPDQQRRIGPPPLSGETDHRHVWYPSLIVEGKKVDKPSFEVWQGHWPKDDTMLSQCKIEMYFVRGRNAFPFPYWIDVSNPHYTYKIRVVDSGSGLISPIPGPMPHRPLEFVGRTQNLGEALRLTLKTPAYYKKFSLYALDMTLKGNAPIPIPFTSKAGTEKEVVFLEITREDLKGILMDGHRYQWIAIPEEASDAYAETEDSFLWEQEVMNKNSS
jgi:hypothetical protein